MSIAFYNENNPVTGRSVLWWVISFFAAIFLANAAFIYFALSSWTGLSTEDAYTKGVRYNETINQSQVQQQLGWQSKLSLSKVNADGKSNLQVNLTTKEGAVLEGLKVSASIIRPVKEGDDQVINLIERGNGIYVASVMFPHLGRWQVEVAVAGQYRMLYDVEVE